MDRNSDLNNQTSLSHDSNDEISSTKWLLPLMQSIPLLINIYSETTSSKQIFPTLHIITQDIYKYPPKMV